MMIKDSDTTGSLKTRPMSEEDCSQIAKLHLANIRIGLLNSLGEDFIKLIYRSMINSDNAFCIVAADDKKIAGFISGTSSISKFYKEFAGSHFIKIAMILLPKGINFKIMKDIFKVLSYPNKMRELPEAESISIVIDEQYRSHGIAKTLLDELIKDFNKRGIHRFKSTVDSRLKSVCKFYEIMGATFHSETAAYEGEKWRTYVWEI